MKNITAQLRKTAMLILVIMATVFVVGTAWAALSIIEPEKAKTVKAPASAEQILESPVKGKAKAPEPSTIALFGSGIIGMMVSFVRRTYSLAKRIFDVVVSAAAIIILSPLFLITALVIFIFSPGPVVFRQTRVGKDGQLFDIFKFRTMRVDAEKYSGPVWASENDPRLIPFIGKLMRKAHIDEIPQFINVLRGEMSVIGPRPERPVFVEKFKKEVCDYEKRLAVKPGITGLAQVWHRYDETLVDVRKKILFDLLYIKKLCLWTDLTIMLRTVRVVVTGEGAR